MRNTRNWAAGTVVIAAVTMLGVTGRAQAPLGGVEGWVSSHQRELVTTLADVVSISSVRGDTANLRRQATMLQETLASRGFESSVIETPDAPLVFGERRTPGATRTLLLYFHYDGQPVDAPRWKQATPFTPVMRSGRLDDPGVREIADFRNLTRFEADWRLYGRATGDDKGPIVAFLGALDALEAGGITPTWNLKVLLDGDEESGSTGLKAVANANRQRFSADLLLMMDGPAHPSGRPTLVFGARGAVGFELTVFGPKDELHSGHYGNWAQNPAIRLARLLASMKDDNGRVLITGFYDGIAPLNADERALLRAVPDDPDALLKLFGLAGAEPSAESLQEALTRPSLNIRGISSGHVGAAATNVIPSTAVASLDMRLVSETRSDAMLDKLRTHIRAQGFYLVDRVPTDAERARYRDIVQLAVTSPTEAYRVSVTTRQSKAIIDGLTRALGQAPVVLRTSGGTNPASELSEAIGAPAMSVPTANFDDNQHTDNENIRLGHLFSAVKTIAALLTLGQN
jgi:acetylornithine deacetylase/succinyl-diaminopimelate desuccinylase-like protein